MIGFGDHNVAGAPRQDDDRGAVGSQVWPTLRVIRQPVDGAPRKFGKARELAVHPYDDRGAASLSAITGSARPRDHHVALFMSGGGTRLLCCNVHDASHCPVCLTRAADLRSTRSTSHQLLGIRRSNQTPNRATPIDARSVARRSSSSPEISTVAAMASKVFPVVQRLTRPHRRGSIRTTVVSRCER